MVKDIAIGLHVIALLDHYQTEIYNYNHQVKGQRLSRTLSKQIKICQTKSNTIYNSNNQAKGQTQRLIRPSPIQTKNHIANQT